MVGIEKQKSADAVNICGAAEYRATLTINGKVLPDPLYTLQAGWLNEKEGYIMIYMRYKCYIYLYKILNH